GERPAIKRVIEETEPLGIQISSATVEEAASWVLVPSNLVFFIGPVSRPWGTAFI
ncbi:hypothetical protein LCGC14_1911460, partial [marine sediment metagenome]